MGRIPRKLNLKWKAATALSFLIYYSGIVFIYGFFRKSVLRKYRRIILTYHRINDTGNDPEITVSAGHFRRHIGYLAKRFRVISVDKMFSLKSADLKDDLAAITFDDGYADNFIHAFPVLKEHSLPATIFLVSDRVGRSEGILSLDQIRVMQQDKIGFGSHTCSHPVLSRVGIEEARREISTSKDRLEAMLQVPVDFFAYPVGKAETYSPEVKKLVAQAGYRAALTMENGTVTDGGDLFEVKRLGIRDVPLFVFKTRISGIFESRPFSLARKLLKAD